MIKFDSELFTDKDKKVQRAYKAVKKYANGKIIGKMIIVDVSLLITDERIAFFLYRELRKEEIKMRFQRRMRNG